MCIRRYIYDATHIRRTEVSLNCLDLQGGGIVRLLARKNKPTCTSQDVSNTHEQEASESESQGNLRPEMGFLSRLTWEFLKIGALVEDPIYCDPYYGDSKKGNLIFGSPHKVFWSTRGLAACRLARGLLLPLRGLFESDAATDQNPLFCRAPLNFYIRFHSTKPAKRVGSGWLRHT